MKVVVMLPWWLVLLVAPMIVTMRLALAALRLGITICQFVLHGLAKARRPRKPDLRR